MDEIDILQGPSHDLTVAANADQLLLTPCREGVYSYGHFGIPCTTFTVLLALQRRGAHRGSESTAQPGGCLHLH